MSRAGRLTLIKSVLSSLPLFYLGLFKMPIGVAKKIICLQSNFFWGGREGKKAIPLVKWKIIQRPKRMGGLGVGDIIIKNAAMLFKWWWRFSIENSPLWKKIICSCHALDGNRPIADQIQRCRGGL